MVFQGVGIEAAASAASTMSGMLGDPAPSSQSPGGGPDQISSTLAGMSVTQLYGIMSQMKALIQQNQQQARQILVQYPQLTKGLFQAQIMLNMLKPPVQQVRDMLMLTSSQHACALEGLGLSL